MRFDKEFSVGVECVCGAKLDAVLVDSDKYDIVIVVDNTHVCPAAQPSTRADTCPRCGANDWRDAIVPDTLEICNVCGNSR